MTQLTDVTAVWPKDAANGDSPAGRYSVDLCFATTNPGKLREIADALGTPIDSLRTVTLPIIEIQPEKVEYDLMQAGRYEDVTALIACDKARRAFEIAGKGVCVEDTGLYCSFDDGAPGPLIRSKTTARQLENLCAQAHQRGDPHAAMVVAFAYYCGYGEPQVRVARVNGVLPEHPRGSGGFGWDAIFIPNPEAQRQRWPDREPRTFAEMTPTEKAEFSARTTALSMMAQDPFQGPFKPQTLHLPAEAQRILTAQYKPHANGGPPTDLHESLRMCEMEVAHRIREIREGLRTPEGIRYLVLTGVLPARALDNSVPHVSRALPYFDMGRLHVMDQTSVARLLAREVFQLSMYINHPFRLEAELRMREAGYHPVQGKGCEVLEQSHRAGTSTTFKDFKLRWEGGHAETTNQERTSALKATGLLTWASRRDVTDFIMGGSMPAMSSSWGAATLAISNVMNFVPCDGYLTPIEAQLVFAEQVLCDIKRHPFLKAGRYNGVTLSNGQSVAEFVAERAQARIGATLKARGEKVLPVVEKFLALGVTRFRIYDAGANRTVAETMRAVKSRFPDVVAWAGNIRGLRQAEECVHAGADGLIVGVTEGDQCSTADAACIIADNPWALYELTRAGIPVPVGVDSGVGDRGPVVIALGGAFAIRPQHLVGGTSTLTPVFVSDESNPGRFFQPRNGEADPIGKLRGGEFDAAGEAINIEGIPGRAPWDPTSPTAAHRITSAGSGIAKSLRFARLSSILELMHMPEAPVVRPTGAALAMGSPHTSHAEPFDTPVFTHVHFHPLLGRGGWD